MEAEMEDSPKCYREKYWSESDTDEKIRRLREQVKRLGGTIEEMGKVIRHLSEHVHGKDGTVLISLIAKGGLQGYLGRTGRDDMDEETYF